MPISAQQHRLRIGLNQFQYHQHGLRSKIPPYSTDKEPVEQRCKYWSSVWILQIVFDKIWWRHNKDKNIKFEQYTRTPYRSKTQLEERYNLITSHDRCSFFASYWFLKLLLYPISITQPKTPKGTLHCKPRNPSQTCKSDNEWTELVANCNSIELDAIWWKSILLQGQFSHMDYDLINIHSCKLCNDYHTVKETECIFHPVTVCDLGPDLHSDGISESFTLDYDDPSCPVLEEIFPPKPLMPNASLQPDITNTFPSSYHGCILRQCNDVHEDPGPKKRQKNCDTTRGHPFFSTIVPGSFHQGSDMFGESSRGRQCVTNAYMSLLYSELKFPGDWISTDIDSVLYHGDILYTQIPNNDPDDYLTTASLPEYLKAFQTPFHAKKDNDIIMTGDISKRPGPLQTTLHEALRTLQYYNHCISCLDGYAISICLKQEQYFVFDSHSRDTEFGYPHPDGHAVLLTFPNLARLHQYISALMNKLNVSTFDMTYFSKIRSVSTTVLNRGFRTQNGVYKIEMKKAVKRKSEKELIQIKKKKETVHSTCSESPFENKSTSRSVPPDQCSMTSRKRKIHSVQREHSSTTIKVQRTEIQEQESPTNTEHDTMNSTTHRTRRKKSAQTKSTSPVSPQNDASCEDDTCDTGLKHRKRQNNISDTFQDVVNDFHNSLKSSCEYICIACEQLKFRDTVRPGTDLEKLNHVTVTKFTQDIVSPDGNTYVCNSCYTQLKRNTMPTLCTAHDLKFTDIPEQLQGLTDLEERLISPRIPFMQVRDGRSEGQKILMGNVVNVPTNVDTTISSLPRTLDDAFIISVQLKRKQAFNNYYIFQNIRPAKVWKAAKYLIEHSNLDHNISLNTKWMESFEQNVDIELVSENTTLQEMMKNQFPPSITSKSPSRRKDIMHMHSCTVCNGEIPRSNKTAVTLCDLGPDIIADGIELHDSLQCSDLESPVIQYVEPSAQSRYTNRSTTDNECIEISGEEDTTSSDTILFPKCIQTYMHKTFSVAPGEGQVPMSLVNDTQNEELSFPTIYGGQKRKYLEFTDNAANCNDKELNDAPNCNNKELNDACNTLQQTQYTKRGKTQRKHRKLTYHQICKSELLRYDRRCSKNKPNIFFKFRKVQVKKILDKCNIAIRRIERSGSTLTAKDVKTTEGRDSLIKVNDGYKVFRDLKTSPGYWDGYKKDLHAMVRQLGVPTWFFTLSAAETQWDDLLRALIRLNWKRGQYPADLPKCYIDKLTFPQKSELIRNDPVTCVRHFHHRIRKFMRNVMHHKSNPVGKILDFTYRFEVQQRGSLHIHGLLWIENAPTLQSHTKEDVVKFIDSYITCSKDARLVSLQTHKHSNTCKRKNARCRFNYPLPPMTETCILEPLSDEPTVPKSDLLHYRRLYKKVHTVLVQLKPEDDIDHETFLGKTGLSPDEYLKAVRSNLKNTTVFLKRKPCEAHINSYNPVMLESWQANLDIKYCVDPYAVIMYLVKYLSKGQRNLSTLMADAFKEKGNKNSIRKQICAAGNIWTNQTEISVQEACAFILSLPFRETSRTVTFVNTAPPSERSFLLKDADSLQCLDDDSTDIATANMVSRYKERPQHMSNICLATFIAWYNFIPDAKYKPRNRSSSIDHAFNIETHHDDEPDENMNLESTEEKCSLQNDDIKTEGGYLRKRQKEKVIRYINYQLSKDSERHYHEKLFLYLPWRMETDLLDPTYEDMYMLHEKTILPNQKPFNSLGNYYDQVIHTAQTSPDEDTDYDSDSEDESSPNKEHSLDPEFICFNPGKNTDYSQYNLENDISCPGQGQDLKIMKAPLLINDNEHAKNIRSLTLDQRIFFDHILHSCKTSSTPFFHVCSSGAGFGKSFLLKCIYQALLRWYRRTLGETPDDLTVALCAFTGKASYNINGSTVHRLFDIPPIANLLDYEDLTGGPLNTLITKFASLKVLIIDEHSMISNALLYFIHRRLQNAKCNNLPFGGVPVICFGDLYQLSPTHYQDIFMDNAKLDINVWKEYFTLHELTTIVRQKDDISFAELLNRLRTGDHTEQDLQTLRQKVISPDEAPMDLKHLFYSNARIDAHNAKVFSNWTGNKCIVRAFDTFTGRFDSLTVANIKDHILELKASKTQSLHTFLQLSEGLHYELTTNLSCDTGLCNGAPCILRKIDRRTPNTDRPSIIWVEFESPDIGVDLKSKYSHLYTDPSGQPIPKKWVPIMEIKSNEFMVGHWKVKIVRRTFPLRPSAAKTIHKCQGDTLKFKTVMNFDTSNPRQPTGRNVAALHYVGLSRLTKLDDLILTDLYEHRIYTNKCVESEMIRLRQNPVKYSINFFPYQLSQNPLNLIFHNIRSLSKYRQDVLNDIHNRSCDILIFCETNLAENVNISKYKIPGYETHNKAYLRADKRTACGTVIYSKLQLDDMRTTQISGVEITSFIVDKLQIGVISVYKSPNTKLSNQDFTSLIKDHISNQHTLRPAIPIVMVGDFNDDALIDPDTMVRNQSYRFLEQQFNELNINQYIYEPTTDYNSALDHCWTNIRPDMFIVNTLESHFSDHKPIYFSLFDCKPLLNK